MGGKGNKDKAVAGLDGISLAGIEYMSVYTPLPQLLGPEVYYSENVEGFEGLGQLGEPITLASVGAAMGVLAGIVAALKQIGDIFPKKTKGSEDFDEKTNEAAENNAPVPGTTPVPNSVDTATISPNPTSTPSGEESFKTTDSSAASNSLVKTEGNYSTATNPYMPSGENAETFVEQTDNSLVPTTTTAQTTVPTTTDTGNTPEPTKETFWDKNKSWLKPVAIGVGGISLIAIGFAVMKPKPTQARHSPQGLSGIPKKRKHHKRKPKQKSKSSKKTAVALL